MSEEKNDMLYNEEPVKETASEMAKEPTPNADLVTRKVVVKRKRFKKSDLLVFIMCLVVSVVIWMYATSLEKTAADNALNKADIEDAVQSGVQSGINKTTESTESEDDSSSDSEESSSESSTDNSSDKADIFDTNSNNIGEGLEIG